MSSLRLEASAQAGRDVGSGTVFWIGLGFALLSVLFVQPLVHAGMPPPPPPPLTLAEAEKLALEAEPGQVALLARAESLEEQSVFAGELPDPTLRVGLANFPIQTGGFTTEGMTQAQVGVRQAFPAGKTRSVSTRQFQSLALEMNESADARGRDILTAVRSAWLEARYWQEADRIVSESRPFFSDLVAVTRSLYSVGARDQQDVLRSELELSRLDDRLIDIHRQRARARALLSQWVLEAAARPVAEEFPGWERLPPIEALRTGLAVHPVLLAAQARIASRSAGIDLAKQRYKPAWALDVGYGYRDGSLPNGDPRSDFLSVAVTLDLPLFTENRQDRVVSAALNEQRAAVASKDELLRRLSSQLDTEYARWQDLSERLLLYEQKILKQSADQARAALAAYQSDASDFADAMRGYIDELNARLEHVRLQIDRAQSYAVLANLGGLPR